MKKLVFILLAFYLVCSGCEKKEAPPPGETKPSEAAAEVAPDEPGASAKPVVGPGTIQIEKRDVTDTENDDPPVLQVDRNAGMEGFLPIRRGEWVLPEDFVIGPLQGYKTDDKEEAALLALSLTFFTTLEKGMFPEELILEESRQTMKTFLDYYIRNSMVPEDVRLGRFSILGTGEGRCTIRLYKDNAVSAGEMYLRKVIDTWYLEDLQVDLSLLEEPYPGRTEPYQPVVYRYLDTF